MEKQDIETILKINGVSPEAPDEEIRSVLLSARYNNDEVDTAVMVLKENTKTHQTRVDGLHKVFRSDEALNPQEISALLGIEVEVKELNLEKTNRREMGTIQSIFVGVVATIIAMSGILFAMYVNHVGIFHPAVTAAKSK